MNQKIMLIDDDFTMHASVKAILGNTSSLISCHTIKDAESLLDGPEIPSLIIIDRVLPDGDGLSLCAKIRGSERLREIPIIFLSSLGTETDTVGGLFAGADDYIIKPVSPLELKARIQARLRSFSKKLVLGNLIVDLSAQRAFIQNDAVTTEIDLTRLEFKVLIALGKSPDRIFSRESLIETAWGDKVNVSDRVVDTHLSHLRKKLKGSGVEIESSRGAGYRLAIKTKKNQAA